MLLTPLSSSFLLCAPEKVIIMHRSGKSANDPAIEVVQAVGYVKIDLDTPTPVLREFIRRFCGGWLNEHAKVDIYAYSTGPLMRNVGIPLRKLTSDFQKLINLA